ncbi:MAG: M55 family metallopeptidase [Myxococcales bacterium]|nr:M55 family metallopeptidase [Myxococcales bacterium]
MAREALLVVDLEGVAGVESPAALLFGTPEYERARRLLTDEVNAAVEGLLAAGFTHVRVSDSHLSGSGAANVLEDELHQAASLHLLDDWYAESLFEDVAAVACLGMHAPAGGAGFAAHTVNLSSRWSVGDRLVSESDLVLDLAAQQGVPLVFISGDDALEAHLGPRVPFVRTKEARSAVRAESSSAPEVHLLLRAAAQRPPVKAPALPEGPLRLDFHLAACAQAASRRGASRTSPTSVEVTGASPRQRYSKALAAGHAADPFLLLAVGGEAGSRWMVEDAEALLCLPWRAQVPPGLKESADRALTAFLALTADDSDASRALRALALHMLEGCAPDFFDRRGLGPTLDDALAAAASVSMGLGHVFDPELLQARIDVWYLRRLRGLPQEGPAPTTVAQVLHRLNDGDSAIYAWLLGELAAKCGVDARLPFEERPWRGQSRLLDLYCLTHLVLLDTDYFARPLGGPRAPEWLAGLLAGAPGVAERDEVDLAGELLFCLAFASEVHAAAIDALVAVVQGALTSEGVRDPQTGQPDAHATASALLGLAAVLDARRPR